MYRITHANTGKVETFRTRKEVDEVVPVSPEQWEQINSGKAVNVASFLGQMTILKIR
jgi:hypothetical protein